MDVNNLLTGVPVRATNLCWTGSKQKEMTQKSELCLNTMSVMSSDKDYGLAEAA